MTPRPRIAATTAALVIALVAGSCGSSSKRASALEQTEPAGPRARTLIELLPADASFAAGLNATQLRSSPLYAQLAPAFKEELGDALEQIQSQCGLDPFTAIQSVLVASPLGQAQPNPTVVVTGIARQDLTRCLRSMAEQDDPPATVSEDGDFTQVLEDNESVWLGWWSNTVLVFAASAERAALADRIAGRASLPSNPVMAALLEQVSTEAGLWVVFDNQSATGVMPPSVHSLSMTVELIGGLKLDGVLRMSDETTAASTAQSVTRELETLKDTPLGAYLTRIELLPTGSNVVIRLELSESELTALAQQISGMDALRLFN